MGKYKKDINRLIELEEVEEMIRKAKIQAHKVLVALLYITGARPSELVELRRKDFRRNGSDLLIDLITKKHGYPRVLCFDIQSTPFVKDLILPFIEPLDREKRIFRFRTDSRIRQIVYKLSGNKFCPYNFRHNRLSRLGMAGAGVHELMHWKGAKNLKDVAPYLYRGPKVVERLKKLIR